MCDLTMGWTASFILQEGYSPAHSFPEVRTGKRINALLFL